MQLLYFYYPIIAYFISKFNKLKEKQQVQVYLLFICFFIFICLAFFDMNSVPDVEHYNIAFETLKKHSISEFEEGTSYEFEYGYILYTKFVGFFTSDPWFLYVIRALFTVIVFYKIVKKYSPNIYISGIVYLMFAGSLVQAAFVIRQYLSIFIFLLAIPSLLQKRLFHYLFITFVSFLFHTAAIVYFPLYFVYHYLPLRRWSAKFTFFLISLCAASSFTVMKAMSSLLGVFQNYYETNGEGLGSYGPALRALTVLIPFVFLYKKAVSDSFGKMCFVTASISFVIATGLWGVGSGSRLFQFYNYFSIFSLPWCFVNLDKRLYKTIFIVFYVGLFSFLFFKEDPEDSQIIYLWETI